VIVVIVVIVVRITGEHSYIFDYDYCQLEAKLMVMQCGVEPGPIYLCKM